MSETRLPFANADSPNSRLPNSHVRAAADARLASAAAAWMQELSVVFTGEGVDAMAALPAGRGEPGSRLRTLFDRHAEARTAWQAAHGSNPDGA